MKKNFTFWGLITIIIASTVQAVASDFVMRREIKEEVQRTISEKESEEES